MPDLFNRDFLKGDESIFKNHLALDISFFPPIIQYRENEQKYIAECIKPLFHNRNGKNIVISGSPGIGKTLAVKAVFKELEDDGFDEEVKPIYINCWKDSSSHRIALDICDAIGYKFTHNKTTNELFDEIKKKLNRKSAVICFDECDKIEDISVIYMVLEQIYNKTLIFITNNKEWLIKLDNRLRSRLTLENLDFRAYNLTEVKGILDKRIEYAFVSNIFDKESLDEISSYTHNVNDLRTGLFLLKESGNIAEENSSKKITLDYAKKAIDKIKVSSGELNKNSESKSLNDDERLLLEIIKDNESKSSKEIYELYLGKSDKEIKYRRFKESKLNKLRDLKLINFKEVSLGIKGTKTIVNLK
ncbi:hypothetical protein CL617_04565 [archaeon]|nr:hypothetical protein [archaeon]|tara:strand:+ start:10277 stop:11356 length:1080 start_codon:yes stop_codon:yes gene_type:complete